MRKGESERKIYHAEMHSEKRKKGKRRMKEKEHETVKINRKVNNKSKFIWSGIIYSGWIIQVVENNNMSKVNDKSQGVYIEHCNII